MNFTWLMTLFIIIPLLYVIISQILALNAKNTAFAIGKNVSLLSITFTLIATEFGGELVLGTSEEAYSSGLYGILYVIGVSLGFLLLGFGFASKMKALNVRSSIDIFELKYGSITLKKIAALLSILTLCGLLLGQVVACKTLLASLGINNQFLFIGFWLLACLYAVTGGITGAGLTNTFQLIYIIISFGGIFLYCIFKEPPSFFALNSVLHHQNLFASSSLSFSNFFSSMIMPALYCIIEQDYAQPLFAARTKKVAIISALAASIFMILFSLVPLYFGIKAKLLNLSLAPGSSPLIPVLLILTNQTVVIIAVCGIITALIATTDYLLWSLSLSIAEQVPATSTYKKRERSIAFISGSCVLAASYMTSFNVFKIISCSYELYDCCLVIPLVMTYFKQDLKKGAAIGSLMGGFLGFLLFRYISLPCPQEFAAMGLSLFGYILGDLIETVLRKLAQYRSQTIFHVGG